MINMKAYKTYEEAVNRLSEVVGLLEQGDLPLEESLKLFEEGTKLTSFCYGALKNAQQKIELLAVPEDQTDES